MKTKLKLIQCGPPFFEAQEKMIAESKRELHFQTYRLNPDSTGWATVEALKKAAARGVKVFFMLDAYGSGKLPKGFENEMVSAGINFKFFSPIFSSKGIYLGRRLHHKIMVADKKKALMGGINNADYYRGNGEPPWLDFAVWLEGQICEEIVEICEQLFGRIFSFKKWLSPPIKKRMGKKKNVQILHNDWARRNRQVYHAYLREIRTAKKYIILMASYFLPGKRIRKALAVAASKGVKIKLILPEQSDVPYMKYGATHLYDFLFKRGIEIYEWNQSMLHGKAMVVDGKWCTLGSFNLMNLSIYGSIETNLEIKDKKFLKVFENEMIGYLNQSNFIDPEDFRKRKTWWEKIRNRISFYIVRRAFDIMTFFSFRQGEKRFLGKG